MQALEITADSRETTGAGSARNLIEEGRIPAIVYGNKQDNLSISLDVISTRAMEKLLKSGTITSTVIDLKVDGKIYKTLVKHIQKDPVKDTLRHLDLIFINPKGQEVDVPIIFEGKEKCLGIKRGGFFNTIHRKLKLMCDPKKIPKNVSINIVEMEIGAKIIASQISLPEGSKLSIDDSAIIATITGRGKGGAAAEEDKKAPPAK